MRREPLRFAAALVSWGTIVAIVAVVMSPWVKEWKSFGFHDWDAETSHRYLAIVSLLKYHEFPSWNPYACGGFPAWGYVEADTILVSPFLPVYLLLPLATALRVEVFGMALLGAVGASFAASRYTSSYAGRALVAALWAVNGRWALQVAAGHTWHLAYAFMPWCLYFFERARARDRKIRDLFLGGLAIAMLVYSGGIYPLPHTVLALGLYAALVAIFERSIRPLSTLAVLGVSGVGLSAPKLLPLLDGFGKAPRLIESTEHLELGAFFTLLTSTAQRFYDRPASVSPYGWHEWGMYISIAGVLILLGALVFVEGVRERALKATALAFLILGFGAFHKNAPWTLLHELPVFRSQHVPSRFLYPGVFLLALVAAAGVGRFIVKRAKSHPWLDLAACGLVLLIGIDIAEVAQKPMAESMWMQPPDRIQRAASFHFTQEPPINYKRRDWAGPIFLSMMANTGVINCYGTPVFERKGARAVDAPDYRGEAYIVPSGNGPSKGRARVAAWTPNTVTIEVDGAEPSSLVVYNMNFDEGWHASTGPVVPFKNAVATRIPDGVSRIRLYYRPPSFGTGILIGLATIAAFALLVRRERRLYGTG